MKVELELGNSRYSLCQTIHIHDTSPKILRVLGDTPGNYSNCFPVTKATIETQK